jgi:hypothetical protein
MRQGRIGARGVDDLMRKLIPDDPVSGGIFLSYRCNASCRHCMYACSPNWGTDWIDIRDVNGILSDLSEKLPPPPTQGIGINRGLHFTGGEPFLNFPLLLELAGIASDLGIGGTFVETNCFWCKEEERTERRMRELRDAGLEGILISINPFTLEYVPIERCRLAIDVAREVFGRNVLVYQQGTLNSVVRSGIEGKLSLDGSLELLGSDALRGLEVLPRGRAAYSLEDMYLHYPADAFLDCSCREELARGWHFHVDNYFNYVPGYCGGISLGDARDMDAILSGVDLDRHPVLGALVRGLAHLYRFAADGFDYRERKEGYVSKCHLCLDLRRHIAGETEEFEELSPREFYLHIGD